MASVRLSGIRKRYSNAAETIKGVDLQIHDGEFMVFVGPSGCGKSTMMRMIAGLEEITGGDLYIGDHRANDVTPAARGVAMVFQSYALYPHMTVAENMGFSLRMTNAPKSHISEQVGRAAEILRITHLLDRLPKELSGGQRQRVAIGRAIVRRPGVFLFDEPLSNLDASLRVEMRLELTKLHKELGSTMIYVTHDQTEAMTMGDRIAVFNAGGVEQIGAPMDVYRHPRTSFVARFIGTPPMNILDISVEVRDDRPYALAEGLAPLPLKLPAELPIRQCVQCGIRPESWQVEQAGIWLLQVDMVEHLGDISLIYARPTGGSRQMCIKVHSTQGIEPGEQIRVTPATGSIHLFDATGLNIATV